MFKEYGLSDVDYLELRLSLWPRLWSVFINVSERLQSMFTFSLVSTLQCTLLISRRGDWTTVCRPYLSMIIIDLYVLIIILIADLLSLIQKFQ